MQIVKTKNKNTSYNGRKCKTTTAFFTNNEEGLRLVIFDFDNGDLEYKLIQGFAGRYSKKIEFKQFSQNEADIAFEQYLKTI
jgi:hypothetical protein